MSDFSSLLGKLQNAAKEVNKSKQTVRKSTQDSGISRAAKRTKRFHGDPSQISNDNELPLQNSTRRITKPRDFDDLKIDISFLCIGAQKAGTTWLHNMLRLHPRLALPSQKELHFFDWHRKRGLNWYSNQFPKCGDDYLLGEITPCYAVLAEEKIAEIKYLFPKSKIIFLARDLVERTWSAILMELRNTVRGMEAGEFTNDHIAQMDKREREKFLREADPSNYDDNYFMERLQHSTHRQRSDYAYCIRRWLRYFPKEQILIINYEDISQRPREMMDEVFSFIGVDGKSEDYIKDDQLEMRFNAASEPQLRQKIRPSLRKKMAKYLKPMANDLNTLLGELGYDWKIDDYSSI